uniref:Myb-like domain-containing protein n=1 Tax=Brassica oleracea var. oleracea TaxID=109376 RepID=A0A0D3DML2_BRAOL
MDSMNPYSMSSNFVDLLNSQQDSALPEPCPQGPYASFPPVVELSSTQPPIFSTETSSFCEESPRGCKERKKWSVSDDLVLINAWLNTSKDPVVGNEQKAGAFWSRIAAYYAASPKVERGQQREAIQCKQRWQKMNDLVCKFCGSYEAATRQKTSGQSESDVVKMAHQIFYNDHKIKFNLHHAWEELKNDQKWISVATAKLDGRQSSSAKKRRFEDVGQEASSQATTNGDHPAKRPVGVKATKGGGGKRPMGDQLSASEFQCGLSKRKTWRLKRERWGEQGNGDDHEKPRTSWKSGDGSDEMEVTKWNYVCLFVSHVMSRDALGRLSLSPLQKCTAVIRVLAYGFAADAVDEYLRLGETTTRSCVEHFVEGILDLFGDEYLRRLTPADLQRLLYIGEQRGFPGMIGSIDCMHWEWKNCLTAWKGQYSRGSGTLNDINVLDRSPVFDDIIKGQAPQVTFYVNGKEYNLAYYLTDGIYPKWTTFIQSIPIPQGPKATLFAQHQEAVRKDVERAFGVLQARFAIVKNPALFWDKAKIGRIMRACIVLHNMIVENEREGYTHFDVLEFQQGEDIGTSHVDLTYSTDIPSNIANMMSVRTRIRDRQMHQQLKADLVEHLWNKFGRDEDNN